jgi:hypothetical protein
MNILMLNWGYITSGKLRNCRVNPVLRLKSTDVSDEHVTEHATYADFLHRLFFDPEEGDDMFLRNRRYMPEDRTAHDHSRKNFKFCITLPLTVSLAKRVTTT